MISRTQESNAERTGREGFVLISVLWILAILTVVALGFANRARLERQLAWYALDHEQALQLARGAVESGIVELLNKGAIDMREGLGGYTSLAQNWAQPVDVFKDTKYYDSPDEEFENDICHYRIFDAESRISLNHASPRLLSEVDGLKGGVIRAISARRNSSEERDQPQRYLTIDDIRSTQEIDDDDWYGEVLGEGLRDVLTVWGDRQGLININTASHAVLRAIPGLQDNIVDAIIRYRMGADGELGTRDDRAFESLDIVSRKLGVGATRVRNLYRYCKTSSEIFTIQAVATRRQGKIRAYCTATISMAGGVKILEWRENALDT